MYTNSAKSSIWARTAVAPSYGVADCGIPLLHTSRQKQNEMHKHVSHSTGAVECKVECLTWFVLLVCFCVICVVLHLRQVVCMGALLRYNKECVYIIPFITSCLGLKEREGGSSYHKVCWCDDRMSLKSTPVCCRARMLGPAWSWLHCSRDWWLFCITCDIITQPIGCKAISSCPSLFHLSWKMRMHEMVARSAMMASPTELICEF